MPKQKKPPKNAFYFYMTERKQELERQGYRFPRGMQDVVSTCHPEYQRLSMEQKNKYEKLAKEAKENEKTNFENKFTTSGESYAQVYRRQEAANAEKNELKAYVKEVVRCDRPEERIYVVMKATSSCEVAVGKSNEEKEYLPLELAIAAFSIKDGSIACYSTLVNTMSVPCGYASAAKDRSEETLLPQPGTSKFEHEAPQAKDYKKIMKNIRLFVQTWCDDYPDPGYFLIFGSDSQQQLACIKSCLEWLAKNSEEDRHANEEFLGNVKYYCLPDLLIELSVLANQVNPEYQSQIVQFGLEGSAHELLKSGCYDYKEEITCEYHKKEDYSQKMHLCCKNFILRRMFLLLEELTPAFKCQLQANHNISEFKRAPMPPHLQERLPKPSPAAPVPEYNSNSERQTRSPNSVSSKSYVEKSHRGNEASSSSYRSADRDRNNGRGYEGSRNYDDKQTDRDRYSHQVDNSRSDRDRDRDRDRYRGHNSDRHDAYERDRNGRSHSDSNMDHEHSNNDVAYDRRRDRDRNQDTNSKLLGEAGYDRRRDQNRGEERPDSNYKNVESSNNVDAYERDRDCDKNWPSIGSNSQEMMDTQSSDDLAYSRRPKSAHSSSVITATAGEDRSSASGSRMDCEYERRTPNQNQSHSTDTGRDYDVKPLRDLDRSDRSFRNPSPPPSKSSSDSGYLKPLSYSAISDSKDPYEQEDSRKPIHHNSVPSVPWGAPGRRAEGPKLSFDEDFPSLGPPQGRGRGIRRDVQGSRREVSEPEDRLARPVSPPEARAPAPRSWGRGGPAYANW